MRRALGFLALALLIGVTACTADGDDAASFDAAERDASEAEPPAPGEVADEPAFDADESSSRLAGQPASGGPAAPAEPRRDTGAAPDEAAPPPLPGPISAGDRIIKEGRVRVELEEGQFDAGFAGVVDAAARAGGSVLSSTTRTHDDGAASGSVTVRVPARAFEDLLVGIGGIGTIRSRDVTAQDVSTEFVDLESRLRHLEAQERFYLGLLDRAQGVQDAIAVQQRLEGIQQQKEQVQGRLRYLDERTSYSTLTVELFETGAEPRVLERPPLNGPSLAEYWEQARDALVHVVGATLVALFFIAPLLIPAGLAFVIWRSLRRPSPARREEEPEPAESLT